MSTYRIQGATGEWEVVIGLEVHAQVTSNAKLFSGASTAFGAEPNTQVSLIDAAMPGMLPVPNRECIRQAVRTGMAIEAQINAWSRFDRKNYFYADLPQGYQISQLYHPIVGEGQLLIEADEKAGIPEDKIIGIERIHVEQDAGKLMHDQHPTMSYVDLNRVGIALMEIVSKPDMTSPAEAGAYVRKLRSILRYVGSCDGNMEEGSMRADVNVSVRKPGAPFGTRCEIKNVNSIRFIGQAIEYEARRQIAIVEDGGEVVQETRLYDPDKNETRSMRSKEEAHDYRYFPCPDLLPLEIEQAWVDGIKATLPELPDEKKARFVKDFGLSEYDAGVLTADTTNASFFEEVVATAGDGKGAANWVINELFGRLKKDDRDIADSPISPARLGQIVALIKKGDISGKIGKDVFEIAYTQDRDPEEIVETEGMKQVTDTGAIETAVDEVIAANPDQVEKAKQNPKLAGWFVGQVMKATGGKANPKAVNEIVAAKLGL